MEPEVFDSIFESAFEHAKKLLQSKSGLMPTGFIFTEGDKPGQYNCQVIPMPFNSDEKKMFYKTMFIALAKKLEAVAVLFVSEAWAATRQSLEDLVGMVRDQPDRREIIVLTGRTALVNRTRTQYFHKEGEEYIFEEVIDMQPDSSSFTDGIFPEVNRTLH